MNFFNRLSIFFFGVFIGLIILILSLSLREKPLSFNYFPNHRVKNYFLKNTIIISEQAFCKMSCYNLDTMNLGNYILESKVDFQNSKIQGFVPKTYQLLLEDYTFIIETSIDSVVLKNVTKEFKICANCF